MGDSVARIAATFISLDRSPAPGRDRERKNPDEFQKHEEKSRLWRPAPAEMEGKIKDGLPKSEKDQTKGKNLDVNA
jgi:hypothetical protein